MNRRERRKHQKIIKKIESNQITLRLDAIRVKINEVWSREPQVMKAIMDEYDWPIIREQTEIIRKLDLGTHREVVETRLLAIQQNLELELKRTIQKYSVIHWLQLESRLAYSTYYSKNPATTQLYRTTFRVAVLKYANLDFSKVIVDSAGSQISLNDISDEMVKDLYRADKLAYSTYMLTADLRNFWKGGVPEFDNVTPYYSWRHTDATDTAIEWMDKRSEKENSGVLSESGIYVGFSIHELAKKNRNDRYPPFPSFVFPNIDHEVPWEKLPESKIVNVDTSLGFNPNYLFMPFDYEALHMGIRPMDHYLLDAHGFNSDQLIQVLILNAYRVKKAFDENPYLALQLVQRGYLPTLPLSDLAKDIAYLWERFETIDSWWLATPKEDREKIAFAVLSQFAFDPTAQDHRSELNIVSRKGLPFLIRAYSQATYIDFRNLLFAIDDFLFSSMVACTERAADKIRNTFPSVIFEEINSYRSINKLWDFNKKFKEKGEVKAECDLSFYLEDVLFLCECKARRQNERKIVGEKGAMINVWSDALKDYEQITEATDFILRAERTSPQSIPKGIKYIVPLVVYPYVTWIAEKRPPYCIGGSVPRFITPNELGKTIRDGIEVFRRDHQTRLRETPTG